MILDKSIEMRWNISNKEHYINKGYNFTKMRENFIVNVFDLPTYSKAEIHVACDICGCKVVRKYCDYLINVSNMNYFSCSKDCSKNKVKQTNLDKYGVEHCQQNKDIRLKGVMTNLKKYGVKNVFQSDVIKERSKQTNLDKYGVEHCQQNKDIRLKGVMTNLKKYGVEYPLQNNEVRDNMKKTNLKKYGVECVFQNSDIKKKSIETVLKKYGVKNISQNEKIKERKRNTCIKNYGEIFLTFSPKVNINSIIYLDMISDMINQPIQHGLNGGEKKFIKYWVDGYIEEYNICIEWDEKYHNTKKQKKSDLKKEMLLIEKFNCKILRIKEREFLNDIDNQLEKIKNEINLLISNKQHGLQHI